ncbi:TIM barrel protein [Solirubrobacter sp. CPCC 204708]|uniref:TIM barrel protein n=1 Tax=Solirubrobacter deserti TaxID=2282478 RepID=A0ABT4RLZ0_9ACTN|nr:TIM barrel protein [Solirubrobacter deserti]MBE2314436.1 TIM barrel protein [Solirubrobacter deserti]MDA0139582.1 TIM barrel protein [Solirubrobacter deserti]
MKGISRRTRACAVLAATGALALTGTAQAQTTFPEKTGDGVQTGQGSIQTFSHRNFIGNGGGLGANPPALTIAPAADGSSCATGTSDECVWKRLDALYGYYAANGLDNIELYGHPSLPTNDEIEGPYGWKAYRAMLDKHGLHASGWHGSLNESQWPARVAAAKILGLDYIGTGSGQADGENLDSYASILRSAQILDRLGKYSVENGVGPVYVHNHTTEFDRKYMDNGTLKTAWEIMIERTDARYVAFQVDAFWSSDAFDDATGTATAAFINKYANRIKLMHVKDGTRVGAEFNPANQNPPNSRGGSPSAFGEGEVDYRPILAAGKGRVQYYSQENDNATLTTMVTSLRNFKGRGSAIVPAVLGLPTTFPSVAAGTPAASNVVPITIKNTGDAPLDITNIALANNNNQNNQLYQFPGERPGDFAVVDSAACLATDLAPNATCFVNVGFKPTTTDYKSVARLIVQSNADNATESILLNGTSLEGPAELPIGGNVDTVLNLTLSASNTFGTFQPATARNYDQTVLANIVSTAGNAALTVHDPSAAAPGRLVNGTFALSQPVQVNVSQPPANTASAFSPISGTPTSLLTFNGPTAGAVQATIGLRQAIAVNEVLRAGTYSKTLTFTLGTTQP